MKKLRYLIYLTLLLPTLAYTQPNGWIILNRTTNSTIVVDSINKYSVLNFNQTTSSVTLTIPNRTTLLTSGILTYLSNIGTTPVNISVTGSSTFSLPVNSMALLKWVGGKFAILYVGSGGGGSYVQIAGDSMTGNLDMKGHNITGITKLIGKTSGDNIWFTPSSGMQINSYSDLYISGFNSTNINGQSIKIQPDNSLDISGSNTSQFVRLNTSALSVLRTVNFPDKPGTFAYTSDISALTASNGLTRTLNDWQLGGLLSSNTSITGGSSRSLTLGSVGSKLTSLLSYTSSSVSMIAANAGSLTLNSTTSDISHTGTGNTSVGGIDARAYVTWDDGTNYSTVSSELNGIGFNTTNGGYTGFFKTSRLLTADRNWQLPDSNGTIALTSNLAAYLPLTLSANTTVAMGSRTLDFTKSGNVVFRPSAGTFYDAVTVQSADLFNRFLYDNIGGPVFTWANASTAGIGITRVGNNTFIAYLKNSNITADRTYQFPNANTTFVGDDAAQTLTNKTISGSSNTISNIANASLSNSTISGVSLGSNLFSLTLGTGLSGTSYNGTSAVTVNVNTSQNISTLSNLTTNGYVKTGSGTGALSVSTSVPSTDISTSINTIVKGDGSGFVAAVPGTDFSVPATISSDATDADYTAVVNSVKYLPSATLSTARTITIPTGSNGDFLEIYNNESGFSWNLTGASVYLSDGTTIITSLYANTNHLIRKVSGKWRILN